MRTIKFRGKRLDNGEWLYGDLMHVNEQVLIKPIFTEPYEYDEDFDANVDPETVGQYADLKDKNGKEVYEGCNLHVLEVSNVNTLDYVSSVEYIESGFLVTQPDGYQVPLAVFHNLENSYPLFEIEVVEATP